MLQAFCPHPFQNADQERHNLLCPVRALDAYVHEAALWHKRNRNIRNMAASKALISGVALQEVCDAEGWSFTRHIHQIVFLGPGLYPRFSSALVLVLLIIFHTGQALVAIFPKRQN